MKSGTTMAQSPKRRYARANGRQKILQTSERLFAEHGYDGVSTKLLVAEADLTIGALYHHFKSKLGVYQATLAYSLANLPTWPIEPKAIQADSRETLTSLIGWFSQVVAADSLPSRLLRRELLDPHLDAPLSDLEIFFTPRRIFRQALADIDPRIDASMAEAQIISLAFGLANLRGLQLLLPTLPQQLRAQGQIGTLITHTLLHGIMNSSELPQG